ncbi:MAG TPA: DUF4369 domain-containing protein [Flavobacterium sp.]|nr:DUF4369 domain-containing protein [Flavobacterium sp.]
MKRLVAALAGVVLLVSCQETKKEGNLHLTGNVKGLGKGTLYIKKQVDTSLVVLDSIRIDNNSHFETWLNVTSPEMFVLVLDRGTTNSIDDRLPFFAEPGNINIETTLDAFFADAKITGSKNQVLYDEFRKVDSRFTDQNTNLIVEKLRAQRLGKPERLDSLEKVSESNLKRRYLYAVNFAVNHRDHEVAPYVALSAIPDVNLKYLDTIRTSMTPKVAKSLYGQRLEKYYKERLKAGQ